jgi:hypothetical protein
VNQTLIYPVIETVILYLNSIRYPYNLDPNDANNRKKHHNDKAGEFFSVHAAKINDKVILEEGFNFSLTLINRTLTVK